MPDFGCRDDPLAWKLEYTGFLFIPLDENKQGYSAI